MPRGMSKTTKLIYEENATNIYKWIEANKHKSPKGILSPMTSIPIILKGITLSILAIVS